MRARVHQGRAVINLKNIASADHGVRGNLLNRKKACRAGGICSGGATWPGSPDRACPGSGGWALFFAKYVQIICLFGRPVPRLPAP